MDTGVIARSHGCDAAGDGRGMMQRWTRRAVVGAMAMATSAALSGRNLLPGARPVSMIDQRIETLGIAGRLAGLEEFASPASSPYAFAIERRFARFAMHPLVDALRAADRDARREGSPIGAWDVLALALHLGPPARFAPLVGYDGPDDDAWDGRRLYAPREAALVRAFYHEAGCASFFADQASFFGRAEREVRQQLPRVEHWVARFFALPPTERYTPLLSLLGVADYGYFRVNYGNGARDTYTIFAVQGFDADGRPAGLDPEGMERMILHETVHAYANQIIDRNLADLLPVGQRLLDRPTVWARVKDTFYNNAPFLLRESIVRATATIHAGDHGGRSRRDKETARLVEAGFEWMPGLVDLLDEYHRSRSRYPDFTSFEPRFCDFIRNL